LTPHNFTSFSQVVFLFRFMLSDANIPVMEKAAQDPERKVTFIDLVPGRLYNITLWTVSGGVTSKPLERQDRLHPEPVSKLNATRITDNEIKLVWQAPIGDYDSFGVLYLDGRDRLVVFF
jgi:receptor-type tyrosine-protein phosphatase beta